MTAYKNDKNIFNRRELGDDEIAALALSSISDHHLGRSSKFAGIHTLDVVDAFRDIGLVPVDAVGSSSGLTVKKDYGKHSVTFMRRDDLLMLPGLNVVGDHEVFDVSLINSHAGDSSFELISGIWRLTCMNGNMTGNEIVSASIRHVGDINEILDQVMRVISNIDRLARWVTRIKGIELSEAEQMQFARAAFGMAYGGRSTKRHPEELIRMRRTQDASGDLWVIHNRIQENLIKPIRYTVKGPGSPGREIVAIDRKIELNTGLMAITETIASRKGIVI